MASALRPPSCLTRRQHSKGLAKARARSTTAAALVMGPRVPHRPLPPASIHPPDPLSSQAKAPCVPSLFKGTCVCALPGGGSQHGPPCPRAAPEHHRSVGYGHVHLPGWGRGGEAHIPHASHRDHVSNGSGSSPQSTHNNTASRTNDVINHRTPPTNRPSPGHRGHCSNNLPRDRSIHARTETEPRTHRQNLSHLPTDRDRATHARQRPSHPPAYRDGRIHQQPDRATHPQTDRGAGPLTKRGTHPRTDRATRPQRGAEPPTHGEGQSHPRTERRTEPPTP